MSVSKLPPELVSKILLLALYEHPSPSAILSVNSWFSILGQEILYTDLRFQSTTQLSRFAAGTAPLACAPKNISVMLSGGMADYNTFQHLKNVLLRCRGRMKGLKQVDVDTLRLCLNTHSRNPNLCHIYDALILVNPITFIWAGPDPDHHFSTAIVPGAAEYMFSALTYWTRVRHLHITHVSFIFFHLDPMGFPVPEGPNSANTAPDPLGLLYVPPSLHTFYLGRTTFLDPLAVASMIYASKDGALAEVRLVDVYKQSIWEARLRQADVEAAVKRLELDEGDMKQVVERIRRIVMCETRTERIIGGDRGEGLSSAVS